MTQSIRYSLALATIFMYFLRGCLFRPNENVARQKQHSKIKPMQNKFNAIEFTNLH